MSNNVHDIRKDCLEMTLCVLACLTEFYVFFFNEIYVGGPKIIYNLVGLETSGWKSPSTKQGVLR